MPKPPHPSRKEPKETVIYPASKRKAPPFKPQRPAKVPQTQSTGQSAGESTARSTGGGAAESRKSPAVRTGGSGSAGGVRQVQKGTGGQSGGDPVQRSFIVEDDEDDENEDKDGDGDEDEDMGESGNARVATTAQKIVNAPRRLQDLDDFDDADDDEDLLDDPLSMVPRPRIAAAKPTSRPTAPPPPAKRTSTARPPSSPPLISSQLSIDADILPTARPHSPDALPDASQISTSGAIPSIPQPLLIRLLHEHFADKATKIDKHAIQVLQTYIETFVREAIARTALAAQERDDAGGGIGPGGRSVAAADDDRWLEVDDLEKIAAGLVLDF